MKNDKVCTPDCEFAGLRMTSEQHGAAFFCKKYGIFNEEGSRCPDSIESITIDGQELFEESEE
jgi:hypothetical protein